MIEEQDCVVGMDSTPYIPDYAIDLVVVSQEHAEERCVNHALIQYDVMAPIALVLGATSLIGTALRWRPERTLARRWS